jgi:hypothetical protein
MPPFGKSFKHAKKIKEFERMAVANPQTKPKEWGLYFGVSTDTISKWFKNLQTKLNRRVQNGTK